jgi:hypothetical protein
MRTPGVSGVVAFTEGVTSGPFFGNFAGLQTNASTGAIAGLATDVFAGGADTNLLLTGAQGGGVNYTLPTVAAIMATLSGYALQDVVGSSYRLHVVNVGTGQTITLVTNTGWTLTGTLFTILNNTWRDFVVQVVSPTAITLTSIGTGTYS